MDDSNTVPYPSPSEPLSSTEQAAVVLQEGLAALQQKDIVRAIAHLELVYQSSASTALRLKAQVGLVKAHHLQGNCQAAIAYCQPLCDNANPPIRAWAVQVMQTLNQRQPTSPDTPPTPTEQPTGLELRYAGRAQKWNALAPINRAESGVMQGATAIALIAILWCIVRTVFGFTNFLGENLSWLQRFCITATRWHGLCWQLGGYIW
ncbi:MAG: hypothetical protein HC881_21500 [Leptolyngbyaceae cyanobacterium SL_7_1]|nr:hypothetical protein [Leptolyngbyaceae cyanobacterium SL_7_1]